VQKLKDMRAELLKYLSYWLNFYKVNDLETKEVLDKAEDCFATFYRVTRKKVETQWKKSRITSERE